MSRRRIANAMRDLFGLPIGRAWAGDLRPRAGAWTVAVVGKLGEPCFEAHRPVVERRPDLAGERLAGRSNEAFDDSGCQAYTSSGCSCFSSLNILLRAFCGRSTLK